MVEFSKHELYGGAVTCQLPSNYIDSSNLREIPSHQEVYLSPETLTNLIIEINQFEASQPSDIDAVVYHFKDVIDPDDTVSELSRPAATEMKSSSLAKFPAYAMTGVVVSKERPKANSKTALPMDWEQSPQMVEVTTRMYQLVVRMKNVETDLCVRINVPLKEFEGQGGAEEVNLGQQILGKVVESLDVVDFGLFEG